VNEPTSSDAEQRTRRAFGARLARLRGERGLSQSAIARALGTNQEVVSRYERGKYLPRLSALLELRRLFSVSLDYLVAGTSPHGIADLRLLKLAREADQLPLEQRNLVVYAFRSLIEAAKEEVRHTAPAGAEP
jgi:transcriptional regulator with XRE-family HTH domain